MVKKFQKKKTNCAGGRKHLSAFLLYAERCKSEIFQECDIDIQKGVEYVYFLLPESIIKR